MAKVNSYSAEETICIGKEFSQILKQKDLVILEGALGGGKTTFVRGVLDGLGCKQRVLSPSYTLMRQYQTKNFLVNHIDLYRLDRKDLGNLGLEDVFYSKDSLTLIEWGDKIKEDLDKYIKIEFLFLKENRRQLTFSTKGYDNNIFEGIKR